MDPLVRRKLGRTNLEVTQLGLGGAGLGDLFDVVEDADANATLQAAWDAGIRYYDTSPWYGRGQSEHRFGRALYRRPRADYVLSTKVGRLFRAFHDAENFEHGFWRGGLKFQHRFDYSYDGVMRSFEDSLQRLGLPRIDLLLIHDLDISHHATDAKVTAYLTELHNGGFRALTELKQAGLISGIGAGINEAGMMPRFLDLMDIDFFLVAMPYTLLDTDVLDSEFPRCIARDVGFVIGAPFASGILATGAVPGARYRYADATPEILAKVKRIEAVCTRHKVPLPAAALQFPLGHPSVAAVIPGALLPEHVARNVAAFRHAIPADFWGELKHEGLLRAGRAGAVTARLRQAIRWTQPPNVRFVLKVSQVLEPLGRLVGIRRAHQHHKLVVVLGAIRRSSRRHPRYAARTSEAIGGQVGKTPEGGPKFVSTSGPIFMETATSSESRASASSSSSST